MRVLHLIKGLGPGGAERLLVNQLSTTHGDIDYHVGHQLSHKGHLVGELEDLGAQVHLAQRGPRGIEALVARVHPDVVHVHSPLLAAQVRVMAKVRRGPPVVTTEHNRWPRHHWATRMVNRLTSGLDAHRFAVSNDVRASMSSAAATRTEVLDHGVPVEQIRAALGRRDDMRSTLLGEGHLGSFIVGIVANFRPEKAYDVFLDAANTALAADPSLALVVVGQGPGEHAFRRDVAASPHADRIHVLGYRADAIDVMAAFDLFTLSSRHEGKPVSMMEAFALGIPVVATRAGGIPEAVEHGVNGLLVEIGDASALATGWLELSGDRDRLAQLAQGAMASAAEFDASRATRSIEDTYRRLAATDG